MDKQQNRSTRISTEQSHIQRQEIKFSINSKLLGVILLTFSFLYMSLEQHRAKYFVYISIITNLIYPLIRMFNERQLTIKKVLLEGSLITSLLYDLWTLMYPHKVFLYYTPQLISTISKVYHIINLEKEQALYITHQLMIFQSKTQVFVLIYSIMYYLLKMKLNWWKFCKLFLLLSILRLKYILNLDTRLSYRELHFLLDRYSRILNVRQYYHYIYEKLVNFRFRF